MAYTKGAPKELIDLCDKVFINGKVLPLTDEMKLSALSTNDKYARLGLRVLAVAYRNIHNDDNEIPDNTSEYSPENIESKMTFLGLMVMADPPRPEVAELLKKPTKQELGLS